MFDNFGKVYVSIEYLAVRTIYVDPDRLLFMFDETILIFYINVFIYPLSNAVLKMAANPTKNTVIRRYDRLFGVTVGRGEVIVNCLVV